MGGTNPRVDPDGLDDQPVIGTDGDLTGNQRSMAEARPMQGFDRLDETEHRIEREGLRLDGRRWPPVGHEIGVRTRQIGVEHRKQSRFLEQAESFAPCIDVPQKPLGAGWFGAPGRACMDDDFNAPRIAGQDGASVAPGAPKTAAAQSAWDSCAG